MEVREMERYASSLKMKEIKRLAQGKEYLKAMKILETLNVDKIRSMADLSVIAEVLICNEQYEDAREILLRIYEKSCTRRIVEQLTTLSLKMKNMEEANEFYNEYLRIAPRDPYRLVLRYKIEKASHVPYAQRIDTLVQLKHEDYMEEWAYELAKLYHKTGQVDKCVEECSDIILWFGQGIIVEKAKLLKEHYTNGFNITDQLGSSEFDATRSLEEVIKQVKRKQRPNVSSPIDIDSTVSASNQFDTDSMYLKSVSVVNQDLQAELMQEVESVQDMNPMEQYQEDTDSQPESGGSTLGEEDKEQDSNQKFEQEETKYILTPEVVEEVRAQVQAQAHQEEKNTQEQSDSIEQVEIKKLQELEAEAEVPVEVKVPTEAEASVEVEMPTEVEVPVEVEVAIEAKVQTEEEAPVEVEVPTEAEASTEEEAQTEVEETTEGEAPAEAEAPTNAEAPTKTVAPAKIELSEEELQRMKERMQQLQDKEVIKTYSHESEEIVEEEGVTYAYGIKLNTIFQNFIENESIKNQLISILKNMDTNRKSNHFMICGDMQTGKTSLARAISITMWKLNRIPTKKVAKITANKLNSINLLEKMEQLRDGSLVIENASMLEPATVESVIKMIEHFDGRILVFLEDRTRNMEELMSREQGLRSYFTHRIIIPRYTSKDIMGFALTMASQQEYTVDEGALEVFNERIEQIFRVTACPEQLSKVKEYVAEVVKRAETRNMLTLMKQAKEGRFTQNVMNKIMIEDICNN